jgi:hypothetical protein
MVATRKAAYLDNRNTSYGFEPTAIIHSMPQASFVYAFILFAVQGFCQTSAGLPLRIFVPTTISVGILLALASFGVWVALHPREKVVSGGTSLPASDPLPLIDSKEAFAVDDMV